MKVRISIARSVREYGDVIIEADSIEAAERYVEQLIKDGYDSQAYCDLVNAASWNCGEPDDDEEVIDSEQTKDDLEADAVVPPTEDK